MIRPAPSKTDHPSMLDRADLRGRLRELLTRDLDATERLLVVLRFAERMSFREIGLVTGTTAAQAERRIESLVERMRRVA